MKCVLTRDPNSTTYFTVHLIIHASSHFENSCIPPLKLSVSRTGPAVGMHYTVVLSTAIPFHNKETMPGMNGHTP